MRRLACGAGWLSRKRRRLLQLLIETAPTRSFAGFFANSMVFEGGQRRDLDRNVEAVFGFVHGFLGSSSGVSKKMLAPF
jgi:hypothetical protein